MIREQKAIADAGRVQFAWKEWQKKASIDDPESLRPLLWRPEAHFIIDLASTNGTFLNGARVERRKIVHGDELRLGDTVIRFSVLEGTVPLSPV